MVISDDGEFFNTAMIKGFLDKLPDHSVI